MTGGVAVLLMVIAVIGASLMLGCAVGAYLRYRNTGSGIARRDSIFAAMSCLAFGMFFVELLLDFH